MMQSTVHFISSHAIERYRDRVDPHERQVRIALLRMFCEGHDCTAWEVQRLGKQYEFETVYRVSETYLGKYVLVVKRGCLVTLWRID